MSDKPDTIEASLIKLIDIALRLGDSDRAQELSVELQNYRRNYKDEK